MACSNGQDSEALLLRIFNIVAPASWRVSLFWPGLKFGWPRCPEQLSDCNHIVRPCFCQECRVPSVVQTQQMRVQMLT